ncbi:tetratricopeptide repeat protein [Telmatospirillum sp. J64-1]|uniref:tetratricopeptide repeat protein n=1 Tax=Telmatospirillum sp. J64-1 TaxID=2502183 RepID=UPI00163D6FE8|nr:tetratricopeptide repeat protein [Telmatospirillum sp. J64-1]
MAERDNPAGDLLLQEVEEDLRREQYQRLWKQYGGYIIAAVSLVVLIVAGYQGWRGYEARQSQADAARYAAAAALIQQDRPLEAAAAMQELADDAGSGYGVLARLRAAALLARSGETEQAAQAYEAVALNTSAAPPYRDLATIMAASLRLETAEPGQLEPSLRPLADGTGPWRHSATELLALLALRQGNQAQAAELYGRLAADVATPQALRARAGEMAAVLGANG